MGYEIVAAGLIFGLVIIVFTVVLISIYYVINSMGIMKLMQAEGMDKLYRAWIPFWNVYIMGTIIEKETDNTWIIKNFTKWVITFAGLLYIVPQIGEGLSFLAAVYIIIVLAIFAHKYDTTASMIISSIFGLYGIGCMTAADKINVAGEGKTEGVADSKPTCSSEEGTLVYETEKEEETDTEEREIEIEIINPKNRK